MKSECICDVKFPNDRPTLSELLAVRYLSVSKIYMCSHTLFLSEKVLFELASEYADPSILLYMYQVTLWPPFF